MLHVQFVSTLRVAVCGHQWGRGCSIWGEVLAGGNNPLQRQAPGPYGIWEWGAFTRICAEVDVRLVFVVLWY